MGGSWVAEAPTSRRTCRRVCCERRTGVDPHRRSAEYSLPTSAVPWEVTRACPGSTGLSEAGEVIGGSLPLSRLYGVDTRDCDSVYGSLPLARASRVEGREKLLPVGSLPLARALEPFANPDSDGLAWTGVRVGTRGGKIAA